MEERQHSVLREIAFGLHPRKGLPRAVFDFAYSILPMINVDLLVTEAGRFLLSWREDEFASGWHVPGGIFRRGETIQERISATAEEEFGTSLDAEPTPAAITEFFGDRGHNISLLYRCKILTGLPMPLAHSEGSANPGELFWFERTPERIYPSHRIYMSMLRDLITDTPFAAPLMLSQRLSERDETKRHEGGL